MICPSTPRKTGGREADFKELIRDLLEKNRNKKVSANICLYTYLRKCLFIWSIYLASLLPFCGLLPPSVHAELSSLAMRWARNRGHLSCKCTTKYYIFSQKSRSQMRHIELVRLMCRRLQMAGEADGCHQRQMDESQTHLGLDAGSVPYQLGYLE